MSLIDLHEEILSNSLENPEFFGVPIKLIRTNDMTEFELFGSVNVISRHISVETNAEMSGKRSNCTIRLSTFLTLTGILLADVKSEILGWIVETSPRPSKQAVKRYMIEDGGVFPDEHLGTITIFLVEVDEI